MTRDQLYHFMTTNNIQNITIKDGELVVDFFNLEGVKISDADVFGLSDKVTLPDPVDHPPHYTHHPSGVECIEITEHMNFNKGNAMKYIWRSGEKENETQDLEKARWYIDREINRLAKSDT